MSKPRKHMNDGNDEALCGRIILDKTTLIDDVDDITCPQCVAKLLAIAEGQDHADDQV